MSHLNIGHLRHAAELGIAVPRETALDILRCDADEIPEVLACATLLRKHHFGNRFRFCSIVNAKSGACSEDCAFCAQSGHHHTAADVFGMIGPDRIVAAYEEASDLPVSHFGVVTSGKMLRDDDIDSIISAVKRKPDSRVLWCASLGCLDRRQLLRLKEAGVRRFHHNLECAESYFPNICSTHSYAQRIDTIRAARQSGLEICSGGILGLGESLEQRLEFAGILAREAVNSIPLNFLVPIPGTRVESRIPMKALDIIRTIAMFRMTNPQAEIKVCAGRLHLRDLQSMIFYAGATGMMMGPMLTIAGRDVCRDRQLIEDLEMSDAEFYCERV